MMCAISFLGAIFMVGLLSDTSFMLKLDGFAGVKIAHVIPIAAVPFILFILNDEHPLSVVKEILDKAVTYKWGILAAVLAVCGYIYISRTRQHHRGIKHCGKHDAPDSDRHFGRQTAQ